MARNTVEIRGMDVLLRKLKAMQDDLRRGAVTKAAGKKGAEVAKKEMRIQVPRRTGDLADSIMDEVKEEKGGRILIGIGPDEKHFYGGILELRGHPWMRPSLDAREDEITAAVGEELKAALLKYAK